MNLTHGWLPTAIQVLTAVVLMVAIGWRSRRWRMLWVPVAILTGVALAALVYWYLGDQGWSQDSAPPILWLWVALTGLAAVVAVVGWPGLAWWRRGASVLAIALCMICVALGVNFWVGYFPTVQSAWDRAIGAEPERWIDQSTLADMRSRGERPTKGVVVKVTIPDDASGFLHREELVYLPPAWFATTPPPRLPVVMAIGGAYGHPDNLLRLADGLDALDNFTARHRGNAPVMVFPDSQGRFSNDTECVNGTRGNAADHLTKDVVPFVISNFGTSSDPANWGLAGWSAGGTCALMLAVMHPELFSTFVDIDGQLGPNAGTDEQTIERLFGGDAAAWASFDPKTVVTRHGPYTGMSAWFAVSVDTPTVYREGRDAPDAPQPEWFSFSDDHVRIANTLCSFVSNYGIECAVVSTPDSHDFQGAGAAFNAALPWLAGKIGTPGVSRIPLPGAPAKQ